MSWRWRRLSRSSRSGRGKRRLASGRQWSSGGADQPARQASQAAPGIHAGAADVPCATELLHGLEHVGHQRPADLEREVQPRTLEPPSGCRPEVIDQIDAACRSHTGRRPQACGCRQRQRLGISSPDGPAGRPGIAPPARSMRSRPGLRQPRCRCHRPPSRTVTAQSAALEHLGLRRTPRTRRYLGLDVRWQAAR